MPEQIPRSIAVVDVGYTNTKVVQFDANGKIIAERKSQSIHNDGALYREINADLIMAFCGEALRALDAETPIDVIVPCAHGAAQAAIKASGDLAVPVMDYMSEAPEDIVAAYRKIEPSFSEVYGPLLPMTLTHGLQLYWQSQSFPKEFTEIAAIMPWIQYITFRLSGVAVSEISGLSCQSQLMNINTGKPSSLAVAQGWANLYAPRANAWERVGTLLPSIAGTQFQGRGQVLAGVHDSNANYLRYLAGGYEHFTLLSTGTWIIGFDTDADINLLDHELDTVTNTNIFGRPVACCRFFGGQEFAILAQGAAGDLAAIATVQDLIDQDIFAIASFTDSGGPLPNTGNKGKVLGPMTETPDHRASLAALYCALMVDLSLNAIQSKAQIIVDGPFAENPVFLQILAALRPQQQVSASKLSQGTTAGAACLGLMPDGKLPYLPMSLTEVQPPELRGLAAYARTWLKISKSQNP